MLFSFGTFDSFLAGLWINQANFALPKRTINQFKPVQQRKQQILRAYCPNIYTVVQGEGDQLDQDLEENQSEKNVKYRDLRKREEAMDQVNETTYLPKTIQKILKKK